MGKACRLGLKESEEGSPVARQMPPDHTRGGAWGYGIHSRHQSLGIQRLAQRTRTYLEVAADRPKSRQNLDSWA